MTIRILIADDHAVVRQGLKMFLALYAEFQIVGEAANGEDAVRLAHQLKPDVVLMDLIMPVMNGVKATQMIRSELPEVEVVALTSVLEDELVVGAVNAGAIGYLIKDTQADNLSQAIKAAAVGRVQLSPRIMARLLNDICVQPLSQNLTEQELGVLRFLTNGAANEEIADRLNLSQEIVKTLVNQILKKLSVLSRTLAVLSGVRLGLVSLDGSREYSSLLGGQL